MNRRHRRRLYLVLIGAGASATTAAACVGADPDPVTPIRGDSGSDGGDAEEIEIDAGPPKQVFVTSAVYDGQLGGLAGADEKCATLAAAVGLTGTFKAWLSIGGDDAGPDAGPTVEAISPSRLTWVGGYRQVGPEKKIVAKSQKQLKTGRLDAPIDVTEDGKALRITDIKKVRTNTSTTGKLLKPNYDCSGFTQQFPTNNITQSPGGIATATDSTWTDPNEKEAIACTENARLYCFEN